MGFKVSLQVGMGAGWTEKEMAFPFLEGNIMTRAWSRTGDSTREKESSASCLENIVWFGFENSEAWARGWLRVRLLRGLMAGWGIFVLFIQKVQNTVCILYFSLWAVSSRGRFLRMVSDVPFIIRLFPFWFSVVNVYYPNCGLSRGRQSHFSFPVIYDLWFWFRCLCHLPWTRYLQASRRDEDVCLQIRIRGQRENLLYG